VDAILMLATLYRHQKRFDESARQLRNLRRFDESKKWSLEIEMEQILVSRRGEPGSSDCVASGRATDSSSPIDGTSLARRNAA
jgi:hypothetical protein